MSRLVDLSHSVESGMTTHPGIPGPAVRPYRTRRELAPHYAPGVSFELTWLELVTSVGTYVDSPAHRHEGLADLSLLPLERYADLPGLVIDVRDRSERAIGPDVLHGREVAGRAVLFLSGWDSRWNTPAYWEDSPYLMAATCVLLVSQGAALVGVDFGNVDDRADLSRPAHSALLAAGLGLVENLRGLSLLPTERFRFHAVPLKLRGGTAMPVRAYAVVEP